MPINIKSVSHKKSSVVENGAPKLPTAAQLELGELAINFADGYETLSIRNSSNEIVTFTNDLYWKDKELVISHALNDLNIRIDNIPELPTISTSVVEDDPNPVSGGAVYDYVDAALPTVSTTVTENDTNPVSGGAVYDVIAEVEEITSEALIDLDERIPENIVTGVTGAYTIWSGTQQQYDALQTYDNNTLYLIKLS